MLIAVVILLCVVVFYLLVKVTNLEEHVDLEYDMHNITIQKLLHVEGDLCDLRSSISRRQVGATCPPSEEELTPRTLPPEFCACVTSTEM